MPERCRRSFAKSRRRAGMIILLVLALSLAPALPAWAIGSPVGTWTDLVAGRLNTPRGWHTATLLPNGKVLAVGGRKQPGTFDGVQAGAELFDPATGKWTPTANSMSSPRQYHTATLLPNGKVLVAGGYSGTGFLFSAELYDPATGQWSSAGSMGTPRYQHTATLLSDGRVLVAGGYSGSDYLDSAVLYTPNSGSGTWSSAGTFDVARVNHTATLLQSGKVLVAGGQGAGNLSSAVLYDPAGGWSSIPNDMTIAHSYHTATLLPNGKVLVAGGFGGGSGLRQVAELYDPDANSWTATTDLQYVRYGHTATLLPNGQVLIAGGEGNPNGTYPTNELYDYANGQAWVNAGPTPQNTEWHTATLLPGGQVLVAGGYIGSSGLNYAQLYDYAAGSWAASESGLNTARAAHTATLLATGPNAGQVLVAAGWGNDAILSSAELYNPATGAWTPTDSLITGRESHTATLLANGQVLVAAGGGNDGYLSSAELYDPATGGWNPAGTLVDSRAWHTATLLPSGKVLVAGGYGDGGDLAIAVLYDPASGGWSATGSLATARSSHTATLLPNGKVLVAGGYNEDYRYLAGTEIYDPTTGHWSPTGDLNYRRYDHKATLLPNGQVLVTGGYGDDMIWAEAELYDPATGTWTETASLSQGRGSHTATLLPSGRVLVAAGSVGGDPSDTAEVYDPGLGFTDSWRPNISTITGTLTPGNPLHLSGSQFRGLSGASGGATNDSATDYPLVQLRRLDNERLLWVPPDPAITYAFSDTAFTSRAFQDFQTGPCLVTVFANGIPSESRFTLFNNTGPPTAVKLKSFTAKGAASNVQLNWQTGSEVNTAAFRLWRREGAQGDYQSNLSLIPAKGGPSKGAKYSYKDTAVVKGRTYYYKLEDIARTGTDTFHGPVSATAGPVKKSKK